MPRASRCIREGYTYHLTHRCHDQKFLLRFAKDRDEYRKWLHIAVTRFGVPVYAYCVTSNHTHIIVHVDSKQAVSEMMQLPAGVLGRFYNRRKDRSGSVWEDRYHATIVEDGLHLRRCIRYVHMNMVRAGVVDHPRQWAWCGHDELIGTRQRYRILALDRLCQSLDDDNVTAVREWYESTIEDAIQKEQHREPEWTEALAVGSAGFIASVQTEFTYRVKLDVRHQGDIWTVREGPVPYDPRTPVK